LETGHISLRSHKRFNRSIDSCGFEILVRTKFGLYIPILAELGGGKTIQLIEKYLHNSIFDWMLWTQAYILKKPATGKR